MQKKQCSHVFILLQAYVLHWRAAASIPVYSWLGIRWPALKWPSWFQNKMEVANQAIAYVYTYASYVFVLYAHILMLTYLLVCLRMYTGQNEFDERLSTGSKGQ